MKNFTKKMLGKFNLDLVRKSSYADIYSEFLRLRNHERSYKLFQEISRMDLPLQFPNLRSQLGQDFFVLTILNFKRHGFFVEFGACDGINLSNTYVLEREFDWGGICVEPGVVWKEALRNNRSSLIDFRAVHSESNLKIKFWQAEVPGLSTFLTLKDSDSNAESRTKGRTYEVETIALNDLLSQHDAPSEIDYISMDTEGSELDILTKFDFNKWKVKIWTIEHNFSKNRSEILEIMKRNGYVRLNEDLSEFDDWYVEKEIYARFRHRMNLSNMS